MNITKPVKITAAVIGGIAFATGLYAVSTITAPAASEERPASISRRVEVLMPTPTLSVKPTVEAPVVVRDEVIVVPPVEEAPAPEPEPEPVVEEPVEPEPAPVPEGDVYDPETDSIGPSICEVLADGTQVPCQ